MAEWFQTKVKYLKQQDNGLIKAVTEQYLVDALSFTEAEGRIQAEVHQGMRELRLLSIARSNIKEIVMHGDTDMWHEVTVKYSAVDEIDEKEKNITLKLLVNSNSVDEATIRTREHLKEMLVPYEITKVALSPIIEVYQHIPGQFPRNTKEVEHAA